jgi:hypothetical protein
LVFAELPPLAETFRTPCCRGAARRARRRDPGVVVERALAPDGLQQILRKNLDTIVAAADE